MKAPSTLRSTSWLALLAVILGAALLWISMGDDRGLEQSPEALGFGDSSSSDRQAAELAFSASDAAAPPKEELPAVTRRAIRGEGDPGALAALGSGESLAFRGLIRSASEAEPLASVAVQLIGEGWELEATTNSGGVFELTIPTDLDLRLIAQHPGYVPARVSQPATDGSFALDLRAEGVLVGQVIGEAKDTEAGGTAELWDLHLVKDEERSPIQEVEIDASGRFAFEQLRSSEYFVVLTVPGFAMTYRSWLSVIQGQTAEFEFEPQRGATVTGRVTEQDSGDPVPLAVIESRPAITGLGWLSERSVVETTSNEQGEYLLEGLIPGLNRLSAEAPWGASKRHQQTVTATGEELLQDFELPQPASLSGSVVNESGQGIAHAQVHLAWEGQPVSEELGVSLPEGPGKFSTRADINGLFSFESLPANRTLTLVAFRGSKESGSALQADLRSRPLTKRLKSGEELSQLKIRVDDVLMITGLVLDSSRKPLAGVLVEVSTAPGKQRGRGGRWHDKKSKNGKKGPPVVPHSRVYSNSEGEFEMRGLLHGSHQVRLERDGYVPRSALFIVAKPPNVARLLEVTMQESGWVRGAVIDENGDAVNSARVFADSQLPSAKKIILKPAIVRSDEFGHFEFSALLPDEYQVFARAKGFEQSKDRQRVAVPNAPYLTIELHSSPTEARAVVRGRVRSLLGVELEGLRPGSLGGASFQRQGQEFTLDGLKPGPLKLNFTAKGHLLTAYPEIIIPPGAVMDVGTLEMAPAAQLSVYVRNPQGKPHKKFSAYLMPLDELAKSSNRGRINLYNKNDRHKFQNQPKAVKCKVGTCDVIPYGRWLLKVDGGKGLWGERTLDFNAQNNKRRVELGLKKKAPKPKKKR